MTQVTIDTPRGRARAHLTFPDGGGSAAAALVLGAGASGSVGAPVDDRHRQDERERSVGGQ